MITITGIVVVIAIISISYKIEREIQPGSPRAMWRILKIKKTEKLLPVLYNKNTVRQFLVFYIYIVARQRY
jgi:hypothetical protein